MNPWSKEDIPQQFINILNCDQYSHTNPFFVYNNNLKIHTGSKHTLSIVIHISNGPMTAELIKFLYQ